MHKKHYFDLLRSDLSLTVFFLSFLPHLLFFLFRESDPHAAQWLYLAFLVLLYSSYDSLGYKWVLKWEMRANSIKENEDIRPRVVQHGMMIPVMLLGGVLVGWEPVLAALIIWITGGCDILYYFITREALFKTANWLYWTVPIGPIYKLAKRRIPLLPVLFQSIAGIGGAIVLMLLGID